MRLLNRARGDPVYLPKVFHKAIVSAAAGRRVFPVVVVDRIVIFDLQVKIVVVIVVGLVARDIRSLEPSM